MIMGLVLLLVLAFPSSLHASDSLSHSTASLTSVHHRVLPLSLAHHVPAPKPVHHHSGLLMDADVRLRAAAALSANPVIGQVAAHSRVPLRMIVITANLLLDL
jgi:hypothetical protein